MNVANIGASGYTRLELIKTLINSNPKFNIANVIGEINAYASYGKCKSFMCYKEYREIQKIVYVP